MEQCPKCGRKIKGDEVFCPGCGERIAPEQKKKSILPLVLILAAAGGVAVCLLIVFSLRASSQVEVEREAEINAMEEAAAMEAAAPAEAIPTEAAAPEEESELAEEEIALSAEPEEEIFKGSDAIHRYELVLSDKSWSAAFQECVSRGGSLANIDSPEEYAYITNQIRKEGKTDITFWLGASSDNSTGEYRWISSDNGAGEESLEAPKYLGYWLPGEPSHEGEDEGGSRQAETCMDLLYRSSDDRFYWNDVPEDVVATAPYLSGKFGYICEYDEAEEDASRMETLILGNWLLPGSNRMYMDFSPEGKVFGYEYIDDPYFIEGDTLIVDQSYSNERLYFTIVLLDGNWLGLSETDSTGRTADAENAVYAYRSDSPEWYVDPALCNDDYGKWVLKDMSAEGLDGDIKGLSFRGGFLEEYYGQPDLTDGGNMDWAMASTGCPGAVIARDGKISVYDGPEKVLFSYDYRIDGDSLFIRDDTGEHEFIQHVNRY